MLLPAEVEPFVAEGAETAVEEPPATVEEEEGSGALVEIIPVEVGVLPWVVVGLLVFVRVGSAAMAVEATKARVAMIMAVTFMIGVKDLSVG